MSRFRTHTNPFRYSEKIPEIFPQTLFTQSGPIDLELGVGRGDFIRRHASAQPQRNFIGVEVRRQLIEWVQEQIDAEHLRNISLFHTAGERVLEALPPESIHNIYIFHPDPWLKKRHQKRRVIQEESLQHMHRVMSPEGRLYISTDVFSLFDDMIEKITQSEKFIPSDHPEFWSDYTTHWSSHSQATQRTLFKAAFAPISDR